MVVKVVIKVFVWKIFNKIKNLFIKLFVLGKFRFFRVNIKKKKENKGIVWIKLL